LQFGGVWTVVIVAQIALTTMLPVPLIGVGAPVTRKAGFPAEAFLTAKLAIDRFDGVEASGDTCRRCARRGSKHATVRSPTGSDRSRACSTSRTPIKCR
jgi:hypothetical protein